MPFKVDEGHVIVPVAEIGGVQYYTMKDVFNTFTERALSAMDVYEEWDQRVKKDELNAFFVALDELLSDPKKIKVGEIASMVSNMKKRVEWVLPTTDIILKFTSVALFDENESPYRYDEAYGRDKIDKWKALIKSGELSYDDFFFAIRTANLIPLPDTSQVDLSAYLKVADTIQKTELKKILQFISQEDRNKDLYKRLTLESIQE